MKLTIGNYEVDIRARYKGAQHAERWATLAFLNSVSLWAYEAGEYNKLLHCNATAKVANDAHLDVYNALDARGYYKGL